MIFVISFGSRSISVGVPYWEELAAQVSGPFGYGNFPLQVLTSDRSIRDEVTMKIRRSDFFLFTMILAITIGLLSCATSPRRPGELPEEVPLPKDINIVAPTADLPKEIAAFSGKWTGRWEGVQESVLIVEEINDREARIILSQEEYAAAREPVDSGYQRFRAKVMPGPRPVIEFEIMRLDRPVITFQMQKDLNTIKGYWVYISDQFEDHLPVYRITLKRVP